MTTTKNEGIAKKEDIHNSIKEEFTVNNIWGEATYAAAGKVVIYDGNLVFANANGVQEITLGGTNGSANFAKDKTLRRKASVSSPNTTFDLANEWDEFAQNTVDNIGVFNTTLSVENINNTLFKLYPNPLNGDVLNIVNTSMVKVNSIKIFTISGKQVISLENPDSTANLNRLTNGLYIVKLISDKGTSVKKLIKN